MPRDNVTTFTSDDIAQENGDKAGLYHRKEYLPDEFLSKKHAQITIYQP